MGKQIEKLLSISSDSFSQGAVNIAPDLLLAAGKLGQELKRFLNYKNGFFSFESALRVFSTNKTEFSYDLSTWNSSGLWRADYADLADGCLFFAEDVFGGQFCIKNNLIHAFDPETGGLEEMSQSFEDWAGQILSDHNVWTGYPLAHEWQEKYGFLPYDQRLMPKVPFVCGGQFDLDNLFSIKVVSGMKSRANLARQIVDMPDGSQIEFTVIE